MTFGRKSPEIIIPVPGPRSRELAARLSAVECPSFEARRTARADETGASQASIVYARGFGSNVLDADGNCYVDLTCGFGSLILGHAPPALTDALANQHEVLPMALGDVYASEVKVDACEAIASLFPEPGARVLLGSSGADALTAALKTATLATGKPGVLAFEGAYHGLSYGPLSLCGLAHAFRDPFAASLSPHVSFLPFPDAEGDLAALEKLAVDACRESSVGIGAIVCEPILGRGGCIVPPPAFLTMLRRVADQTGALLVVDEVWTGLGRAGSILASTSVVPDVLCLGKGLGAGFPVSACVGKSSVMAAWGAHGGTIIHPATHCGSPLASTAVLVALQEIQEQELPKRARDVGSRFAQELRKAGFQVTGQGLMLGIHFASKAEALRETSRLLGQGYIVLTGGTSGNVVTLTPALNVPEALLEGFVSTLTENVS